MSTVTVTYGFHNFKCNIKPSSVLNDVLTTCLIHFKLSTDKEAWSLVHADHELPLTLPLRLLNLPAGAKLLLKGTKKTTEDTKPIRIKFQIVGFGSEIIEANRTDNVLETVKQLCERKGWKLPVEGAKLQIFAKVLNYEDMAAATFAGLGIHNDVSVRLTISSEIHKPPVISSKEKLTSSASRSLSATESELNSHVKSTPENTSKIHEVATYLPTTNSPIPIVKDNESDYEVTVNHVRKYQEMLSRKAGSGSMLTKRLREQQQPKLKHHVEVCNIRVKFPDRTHIEVSFKPDETIDAVYEVVRNSLVQPQMDFWLSYSHPHQRIEKSAQRLEEDLHFSTKTMLLLETHESGPYLNPSLMQFAKDMSEAVDVKLDRGVDQLGFDEDKKSETSKEASRPTKGAFASKTPKWLKLSKK